jgi:hypothetical protein
MRIGASSALKTNKLNEGEKCFQEGTHKRHGYWDSARSCVGAHDDELPDSSCLWYMYNPPVSDFSGYQLHLITAPQRVFSGFGLRTHLAGRSSGAFGSLKAKYAKPEKLPHLPVRTMLQTVSTCARESLAGSISAKNGPWWLPACYPAGASCPMP